MRRLVFRPPHIAALTALALLLATAVNAGAAPAGVSLRWDNCYSDGGAASKTFACDTNSGSERLVMSFVVGDAMPQVFGTEMRLLIVPASTTLPAWWAFKNLGTCRLTALGLNLLLPPGSVNCEDWETVDGTGGIGAYDIGFNGRANGAVVKLAVAVPASAPSSLVAGQEYFAGNLTISHAKTVGAGACTGCDVPVCIVLDYLKVATPAAADDRLLLDPAFPPASDFARWQNGQETNVQLIRLGDNFGTFHDFGCQLSATPTRNATWGAVKALYR